MAAPQCTKCARFNFDHTCEAFPCGVPDEVFLGAFDHLRAYPGDAGIRFEKISEQGLAGSCHDYESGGEGRIGELTRVVTKKHKGIEVQLPFDFDKA